MRFEHLELSSLFGGNNVTLIDQVEADQHKANLHEVRVLREIDRSHLDDALFIIDEKDLIIERMIKTNRSQSRRLRCMICVTLVIGISLAFMIGYSIYISNS